MQFSFYVVYSSLDEINFRFLRPEYFFKGYDFHALYSHAAPVYRKVKGKSRGSSKGYKVLPMRCVPLDHP